MKIIHKTSKEEINVFPHYTKHHYGIYGYIVLTIDYKVLFFYLSYCGDVTDLSYEDVTDDFEIIN